MRPRALAPQRRAGWPGAERRPLTTPLRPFSVRRRRIALVPRAVLLEGGEVGAREAAMLLLSTQAARQAVQAARARWDAKIAFDCFVSSACRTFQVQDAEELQVCGWHIHTVVACDDACDVLRALVAGTKSSTALPPQKHISTHERTFLRASCSVSACTRSWRCRRSSWLRPWQPLLRSFPQACCTLRLCSCRALMHRKSTLLKCMKWNSLSLLQSCMHDMHSMHAAITPHMHRLHASVVRLSHTTRMCARTCAATWWLWVAQRCT